MSARPGCDRGENRFPSVDSETGDVDYQGEWSSWVGRAGAPQRASAPEPGSFGVADEHEDADRQHFDSYRDEFDGLIDRSRGRRRRPRWVPPLLGALGVAALVFAAAVSFGRSGSTQQSQPQAAPEPPASTTAPAPGRCQAERVGNRIQGNGAGGSDSGPAAIFAFQYAYYVSRSGELARATATQDAAVPTAEAIQQGIDSIPAGTTHCVSITPSAFAGQYLVVVTEYRPGQAPLVYNPQVVTTAKTGNRTLISAINRS